MICTRHLYVLVIYVTLCIIAFRLRKEDKMEYTFSDKLSSLKPSAIREIFKSMTNPDMISFAAGNPAPESFPIEFIQRESANIMAHSPVAALQYSITEGYTPLREAVETRLKKRFSSGRVFDSVIITSGGQQGIELACKAFCNENDTVICENPSFIGALNAFRSLGTKTVGVELEDDGVNTDMLREIVKNEPKAKILYLIPTFHNPAGITTSYEKRKEIYNIALDNNLIIVEDNPYGELRFAGEDVGTLKSMDTEGIVIYCGSFSKILSAGMRVGFVQAPTQIISKLVVAKQVEDVHTNIFFQMLCERFMNNFDMDGHISKIQSLYRQKCNLMLDTLDRTMPNCVKYTRPEGGLFLWCTLPSGVSMPEIVRRCLDRGVAVVPGTAFNCDTEAPSSSFRLNYSTPSCEQIERGITILSETVREMI